MTLDIIPYMEVDGVRTYKDSFIKSVFDYFKSSGNKDSLSDGSIKTSDEFLHVMKNKFRSFVAYYNDKPV